VSKLRWFRIGPGMGIALALIVFMLWQRSRRPEVATPVVVERPGSTAAVGRPDPPFVLERATELRLSAAQRSRLARLADDYDRRTKALREELDDAAEAAEGELSGATQVDPASADFASHMGAVANLSRRLAEARAAEWPRLCEVLTPSQQERARQAWADAHTARPRAAPSD